MPPVLATNGETVPSMMCWKCMRLGHISRHCPDRTKVGGVQHAKWTFTHVPHNIVPKNWLLLDSGSMISSVYNADLLSDIISIGDPVKIFTNGGSQDYHQRGTLKMLDFKAYFNPTSMANILSLSEISDV